METADAREKTVSRKVIRFLKNNMGKPVSVKQLAGMFYMSPNYLGDIFKKETGESIKQYEKRLKMQKAIILLSEKGHSVAKIAELLGYESQPYFSKVFKAYYGYSPTGRE
jgi:two-component system response regulator YesN